MKIGILTQPLHNNYGGLLQNYALQQTLKRMGHEVVTIDHGIMKVPFLRLILSRIKLCMWFLLSQIMTARMINGRVRTPMAPVRTQAILDAASSDSAT